MKLGQWLREQDGGPGGPAPFLDLLKTWGWGPPASPASQTDAPISASKAQIPLGATRAVNSSPSLSIHLFLLAISLCISLKPLCRARDWALSPKSLSCHVAIPPSEPLPWPLRLLLFSLRSCLLSWSHCYSKLNFLLLIPRLFLHLCLLSLLSDNLSVPDCCFQTRLESSPGDSCYKCPLASCLWQAHETLRPVCVPPSPPFSFSESLSPLTDYSASLVSLIPWLQVCLSPKLSFT